MLSYTNSYSLIEEALSELSLQRNPIKLYEPIDYILSIGGKRIRPSLSLMACSMFTDNIQEAIPSALAIEVFHNFTLLHDDIMDNAPIRRNNPTVHSKWDMNTAILSGDAMMILSYELLQKSSQKVLPEIFRLFTKTALEVCEGQQYDMDFEQQMNVSVDEYLEMIRLKTAVLIAASLAIGAIVGGASKENVHALYECGQNLGIAFQLQDDYLDIFAEKTDFGKTRGGDIAANKKTYLLLSALNSDKTKLLDELHYWLGQKSDNREEKIEAVSKLYKKLGVDRQTMQLAEKYFKHAEKALDSISVPAARKTELISLLNKLIKREQ